MFNPKNKSDFLSKFPISTQRTYGRVFIKSYSAEELYNKDLMDFSLEEIEQVLMKLTPLTVTASRTNLSIVNSYILSARGSSPLDDVKDDKNYVKKFVSDNIELYISKNELDDITCNLVNAQDAVLFQLLFEGVDVHEICNLKKSDVNYEDNYLHLIDSRGNSRSHEVSYECISLIRKASQEKTYLKSNGIVDQKSYSDSIELVDSEYVIRLAKTRNASPNSAVSPHVIYRRLKTMAEWFDNPYLTSKNIFRSGQIFMGYLLWVENGKPLDSEYLAKFDYLTIAEVYNISIKKETGLINWVPLREYVNLSKFIKLYEDR